MTEKLINLTIDGKTVAVPKGTTVYNAAKHAGFDIPIFCYQDRMPPFGACRMCLVEVENMAKLQASCTLEATEGMSVRIQSDAAIEGREGILELLLINHPLDCPICDRAGECPLQDQTYKHGPGESRFYEEKRHFTKALPLGPVLMLDRERCIACARCTRFCDHLSGDHALEFKERGYRTEIGTPDNGPADSKFIGNTIMICPVGALTSQVYRFRARPWDNKPTRSTCTLCPVGCSLYLDSRDGEIVRTRSHENKEVNDIWLCDKGWFGYEFCDSTERFQTPLIRENGEFRVASWDEALDLIAQRLLAAKPNGKIAGFGGNPLTVEENDLFQNLFREGLGVNHLDHRIGMPFLSADEEGLPSGMELSIGECENLDFVLLCGVDLTEEFPVIWLRLRQAIHKGATVIFLGHYAPEIAPYLTEVILHAPGEEIDTIHKHQDRLRSLIEGKKKSAVFIGQQYLATKERASILNEINLFSISMNLLEGRGNSFGAQFVGMTPEFGPHKGLNALEVLESARSDGWDVLYVAGANPAKKFPSQLWKEARKKIGFLVVQELFVTETALEADVILPVLSYVEKTGHFINLAGDIQKLSPGKAIPEGIFSDQEIFHRLAKKLYVDSELSFKLNAALKSSRIILNRSPKYAKNQTTIKKASDSLKATFGYLLFDSGTRMKNNPHLSALTKAGYVIIHPEEAKKRELADEECVTLNTEEGTIKAKLRLSEKIAQGTIYIPLGLDDLPAYELGGNLLNGMDIQITKK